MRLTALILAAGRGTRMRSDRTKVLHEISGLPMIEHVICACASAGAGDIVIIGGANMKELKTALSKKYPGIKYALQKHPLGTGHAVLSAFKGNNRIKENVLVLSGDVPLIAAPTIRGLINDFTKHGCAGIIGTSLARDPQGYGRIIRSGEDVAKITEEKDCTEKERLINEVNGGIYVFRSKELLKALKEVKKNPLKNEYYLTDVVEIMAKKSLKIRGKQVSADELTGINDRIQLAAAAKVMNKKRLENLARNGITIVDFDTVFIDENVTVGQDTVIHPFCVIKGPSTIGRNCVIGPSAHIRPETVIGDNCKIGNYVEVKKSKIGSNTNVSHLSYIGDAELGSGINIGAGTITANYDGKKKHKTVIGEGSYVGSNVVFVAPVKAGKNSVIGAGSVITDDVPDNALAIARCRQTVKAYRRKK